MLQPALIIGAGVGGLTASAALTHAGVENQIFEASPVLKEVGAGLGIQYGAMKGLRRIGLLDSVSAIGQPLLTVEMATSQGQVLARIPHDFLERRFGVRTNNVARGEMLSLMVETVGMDRITLGARCVGFDEDADGVTAHFADGSSARGSVLVVADGVGSSLRDQIVADGRPRETGVIVWRGIPKISHPAIPIGTLRQSFGKGEFFAFINSTEGRVFWFACGLASRLGANPPADIKAEATRVFADWAPPTPQLIAATDPAEVSRVHVKDRVPASTWVTSRVALLGDAAHPMMPTLGQGGSAAIEDGVVLAKYLADADLGSQASVERALKAYEAERTKRTSALVKLAHRLGMLAMTESTPVRIGRDLALRLLPQAIWQRQYLAQHSYDPNG